MKNNTGFKQWSVLECVRGPPCMKEERLMHCTFIFLLLAQQCNFSVRALTFDLQERLVTWDEGQKSIR